jgi:hypothetical protein
LSCLAQPVIDAMARSAICRRLLNFGKKGARNSRDP